MPKKGTVSRRVGPFVPLALALLMQNAVLRKSSEAADNLEVAQCEDVQGMDDCHTRYPHGCTLSEKGRYDTFLNLLKNEIKFPNGTQPASFFSTKEEFQNLDRRAPADLGKLNHIDFKDELIAMGEEKPLGVVGFLYYVTPEDKDDGETSNCKLSDSEDEVDFHIGIGFDAALAQRVHEAANGGKKLTKTEKDRLHPESIVVEMTPQYRAHIRPEWTSEILDRQLGRQVKVAGQLLLDNEHNIPDQNCALPGAKDRCIRASAWELHPVTRFQVCQSSDSCDLNSNDWIDLEKLSEDDTGRGTSPPASGPSRSPATHNSHPGPHP